MNHMIQAEWLKEKRSANNRLLWLVPVIFMGFSFLMSLLMGQSPDGKSYLVTSAFNWYPLLILPIVISLLVTNTYAKEKKNRNDQYFQSLGLSKGKQYISKNIVVLVELFIILVVSTILLLVINRVWMQDPVSIQRMSLATLCLFLGSLPMMGMSFLLYRYTNKFVVILVNFLCTGLSAIIAVKTWWYLFPWSYSIRMMAPVLGIHPNGTFLESSSPLLDTSTVYTGSGLGIAVYLTLTILSYWTYIKGE